MRKYIRTTTIIAFFIYLIILIIGCNAQTKLIFHPKKLESNFQFKNNSKFKEVNLTTSDGITINSLFFPMKSEKVILYLHGNAGCLDSWQHVFNNFKSLEYNFFIIDYRGYGKSSGDISEKGLYLDAEAAYKYLNSIGFKDDQIIIYGRSIGTGVATDLAQNKKINALILETPFTSMQQLAQDKFPYLFPSLFLKYKFDNIDKINNISAPLLIIHGKQDEVIPFEHGKALYNHYNSNKLFLEVETGKHNDLSEFPEFSQGILIFLNQIEK